MSDTQRTLVALLRDYIDELVDHGIPDPLNAEVSISSVLLDLLRLAGVDDVASVMD